MAAGIAAGLFALSLSSAAEITSAVISHPNVFTENSNLLSNDIDILNVVNDYNIRSVVLEVRYSISILYFTKILVFFSRV